LKDAPKVILRQLDPGRVRFKPLRSRRRRIIVSTLVSAAAAIALSATTAASSLKREEPPPRDSKPRAQIPSPADPSCKLHEETETTERPTRFFDPYYVFTEIRAEQAAAYPLASPPGIVVDLDGVPEPTAPTLEQIGDDKRVLSARRLTTATGLRYIIRVSHPIARIELIHEGQVAMLFPTQ